MEQWKQKLLDFSLKLISFLFHDTLFVQRSDQKFKSFDNSDFG